MAKKALADIPYLLDRDGRYFARVVIPAKLRPFLNNKTELREPLGPDRRAAKEVLNEAVGRLKATLRQAARAAEAAGAGPVSIPTSAQTPEKIMVAHYRRMIDLDNEIRNSDHRFARFGYADEQVVEALRQGIAGALSDGELMAVIGERLERFRKLGYTTAHPGTDDFKQVARAIRTAEYAKHRAEHDIADMRYRHLARRGRHFPQSIDRRVSRPKPWLDNEARR